MGVGASSGTTASARGVQALVAGEVIVAAGCEGVGTSACPGRSKPPRWRSPRRPGQEQALGAPRTPGSAPATHGGESCGNDRTVPMENPRLPSWNSGLPPTTTSPRGVGTGTGRRRAVIRLDGTEGETRSGFGHRRWLDEALGRRADAKAISNPHRRGPVASRRLRPHGHAGRAGPSS